MACITKTPPSPVSQKFVKFSRLERQQKDFLKLISNLHIALSFLFIWDLNDKYVHALPNSLENLTRIQTKITKSLPVFRPKSTKTIPFGAAHSYKANIRELAPPSPPSGTQPH